MGVRSSTGSLLAAVGLSPLGWGSRQGSAVPRQGHFLACPTSDPLDRGELCQPSPAAVSSCLPVPRPCGHWGRRVEDRALILQLPAATGKGASVAVLWVPQSLQHPVGSGTSPVLPPGSPPVLSPRDRPRAPCFDGRFACKVRQLLGAHCGFPQQLLSFLSCCCWLGLLFFSFFLKGQTDLVGWNFLCVTFVSF